MYHDTFSKNNTFLSKMRALCGLARTADQLYPDQAALNEAGYESFPGGCSWNEYQPLLILPKSLAGCICFFHFLINAEKAYHIRPALFERTKLYFLWSLFHLFGHAIHCQKIIRNPRMRAGLCILNP